MDRDKPREQCRDLRRNRCVSQQRIRLASSLCANYLKLGAGATLCALSCVVMSGIAVADDGQIVTTSSANLHVSEIRLKPIGATISFQPIAQPNREASSEARSQTQPAPIQLDPMTGVSDEMLEQPVLADQNVPQPFADFDASQHDSTKHPQFLSIRGFELKSTTDRSAVAVEKPAGTSGVLPIEMTANTETPLSLPPSILVPSLTRDSEREIAPVTPFKFNEAREAVMGNACERLEKPAESLANAVNTTGNDVELISNPGALNECVEAMDSLPLLPVPNRQWVAPTANDNDNDGLKRAAQHISLTAPRTISVAQVKRLSTPHAGVTVPARFASYARHVQAATPQPRVVAPAMPVAKELSATELLMKEIHDSYPGAQVVLANADGELVARGNCSNRKHATAIIRMIRSRLLVPVDDCLVVQ